MASAEDWIDKYYPTPASKVSFGDALEHSIRKWEGLDPKVLEEHGLESYGPLICPIGYNTAVLLVIDDESCALCRTTPDDSCEGCVLYHSRGDKPCDVTLPEEETNPYDAFCEHSDNKPMLEALKKCLPKE